MSFYKLTTTGNSAIVVSEDLGGRWWVHPVVGEDLLANGEFTFEELLNSQSLKDLIDAGDITVELKGSGVITTSSGLANVSDGHTIGSHIDVILDSVSDGEILSWQSGKFVNKTPSESGIATESYVDNAVDGLYNHQGGYDASTNTPDLDSSPTGIQKGFAYKVTVGGLFFTEEVSPGDLIIVNVDDPSSLSDFTVVQDNLNDATTTVKGIVELATDGESASGVVVQGNDSRLSDDRNPLPHTHDASAIVSGTFADARISQSSVTQHEGAIDHDALINFVANEHVDHISVSINSGEGLSGGGDITTTRTIHLDINSLTEETSFDPNSDFIVFYDTSTNSHRKMSTSNFLGSLAQFYTQERTTSQITTSTSFINYTTLTLTSIPSGIYKIEWFYVWSHNSTSTDFICQIQLNNSTNLIDPSGSGEHRQEPQDSGGTGTGGTNQRYTNSGFSYQTLSSGNHTIDIDFSTSNNDHESTMYHCVLSATKVG